MDLLSIMASRIVTGTPSRSQIFTARCFMTSMIHPSHPWKSATGTTPSAVFFMLVCPLKKSSLACRSMARDGLVLKRTATASINRRLVRRNPVGAIAS